MLGFLDLIKLVEEEELSGAVKSVNKACWEIEMARQLGGTEVSHPWKGEYTGGFYEDTVFHTADFDGFDHSDYASTPEDIPINRCPQNEREIKSEEPKSCCDDLSNF